jgi:Ulp1 protease family, C-terminal catalytic domain
MNNKQIIEIIHLASCDMDFKRRKQFGGVWPINYLKRTNLFKPGKRRIAILNSDPSYKPGQHWFVFGIDARSNDKKEWHAFIFDSLAQAESHKYSTLKKFLQSTTPIEIVLYNRVRVQSENVDSCALHAIYFCVLLIKLNYSFLEAMQTFHTENLLLNDCELLSNFLDFINCNNLETLFRETIASLDATVNLCT